MEVYLGNLGELGLGHKAIMDVRHGSAFLYCILILPLKIG